MCSFCAFADKDIFTMPTAVLYRHQDPCTDILKSSGGIVCTTMLHQTLKSNFVQLETAQREKRGVKTRASKMDEAIDEKITKTERQR